MDNIMTLVVHAHYTVGFCSLPSMPNFHYKKAQLLATTDNPARGFLDVIRS